MGMHDIQRPRTRVSALTALALGALLALGLAWAQPSDPAAAVGLVIVDEVGAIVGVGELGPDAAVLELTVEAGGILKLVLVTPTGALVLEREVFVGAGGGLVVTSDAGFEALEVFAARYTPSLLDVRRLESLVAEQAAERWKTSGLWFDRSLLPDVVPTDRIAAALARGPFDDAIEAEVVSLDAALDGPLDEGEEVPTGVAEEAREGGREFGMDRRDEALERAPEHAGESGDAPDVDGPPAEVPPVDAPPVDAPPVETPVGPPDGRPADPKDPVADPPPFGPPIVIDPPVEPVPLEPLPDETPPVEAPPVEAPPVEAPPGDDDTTDDEEETPDAP